jgi:hypothetical protein
LYVHVRCVSFQSFSALSPLITNDNKSRVLVWPLSVVFCKMQIVIVNQMHQRWNFCTPVWRFFFCCRCSHFAWQLHMSCLSHYWSEVCEKRCTRTEAPYLVIGFTHVICLEQFTHIQLVRRILFCKTGSSIIAFTHDKHWTLWQNILIYHF